MKNLFLRFLKKNSKKVRMDLKTEKAHFLILGTPGVGKSVLINHMIKQIHEKEK